MRFSKSFLVVLLLAIALFSYGWHRYRTSRVTNVAQRPRNIYIITASGLRPDHLTCYLYDHDQTPAIDFLAYDGIRFLNAYSTSSDSLPAHLSLLNGLYPFSKNFEHAFSLPKYFSRKGYKTAAFLSDPELRAPSLLQEQFADLAFGDRFLVPWQEAYSPAEVSRLAREWVNRNADHPQFLLLNFGEPTDPFRPPHPYDVQYAKHLYDGEIAGLDAQVGLFIHALKTSGLFANSIVVFAAPYGESLEKDTRTGSLKPSIIRIPLLIAAPGLLPVHQEYNHEASLIDVFPSILALLDQRVPDEMDGIPLFKKGTSEEIVREFVFAETRVPVLFGLSPDFFITNGKGYYETAEGSGETRLRTMLQAKVGKLSADSGRAAGLLLEQVMVLAKNGDPKAALAMLDSSKDDFSYESPALIGLRAGLADATGDHPRARALYEQAASVQPDFLSGLSRVELELGNPKQASQEQQKLLTHSYLDNNTTGVAEYRIGDYSAAERELSKALEKNPRLTDAYLYRGMAFGKEKKLTLAEADFKKAFELDPQNEQAALELAKILELQKRASDGIPYFLKLLQGKPKDYASMLQLAHLQQVSGNDKEARKWCEQVLLYSDDLALRSKAREMIAR
jgi:arylsulfatase A-like enzyme/Tfp pilus assembly protein PilF